MAGAGLHLGGDPSQEVVADHAEGKKDLKAQPTLITGSGRRPPDV